MPETFGYISGFSPSLGLLFNMQPPDDWLHYMMPLYKGRLTPEKMTLPGSYKDKTFILMNYGKEDYDITRKIALTFSSTRVKQ